MAARSPFPDERRSSFFLGVPLLLLGGAVAAGCSAQGDASKATGGEASATGGRTAEGGQSPAAGGGSATGGASSSGGSPSGGGTTVTGGETGAGQGGLPSGGNPASNGGATPSSGGRIDANGGAGGMTGKGGAGASAGGSGGKSDPTSGGSTAGSGGACDSMPNDYDQLVLCEKPVGYWAMNLSSTATEADLSGHGNAGAYKGPTPTSSALPNGDPAASFNGASNYLTIPSKAAYSIPTTGNLSWEAWIRPAVLQFPNDSGGYVDWMGKCADYSPTCEWEARLYNTDNSQARCNRLSAYVFNPGAGLGSGADFQPTCGLFQANTWFHVVGEYTTRSQPADCEDAQSYPGAIDIWVNGVKWNHSRHGQTGCFSQYQVVPKANGSPVNVGTMAGDAWFQGAIGKVALYDYLLSPAQISAHYRAMTGKLPTGTCADTCTF